MVLIQGHFILDSGNEFSGVQLPYASGSNQPNYLILDHIVVFRAVPP